jgi:hypothetical protein
MLNNNINMNTKRKVVIKFSRCEKAIKNSLNDFVMIRNSLILDI